MHVIFACNLQVKYLQTTILIFYTLVRTVGIRDDIGIK
jgi:hypothetical protein